MQQFESKLIFFFLPWVSDCLGEAQPSSHSVNDIDLRSKVITFERSAEHSTLFKKKKKSENPV